MKKVINFLRKKYIPLLIVVFLAGFLRFYQLGTNPPSLTWDEAAWGYNAYSLGVDGRDEFGRFLPIDYLESFGDFKPPMYAYLTIVPVWLFGLTEFATRFASAFFGILTVLLTYFLVLEIFGRQNAQDNTAGDKIGSTRGNFRSSSSEIAILASFMLAVSPWHILLSRAAFEANVATFFIVAGVYFFISSVRKKSWLFILSAISFSLSVYTFNSARIVSFVLILILAAGFWKGMWKMKKQVVAAGLIGAILVLPIIPFLFSPQAKLRYNEVNIFSDTSIIERSNQEILNDKNSLVSRVIHNRRFYYGLEVAKHYFDNLSFNFLFIEGDRNPKFATENVGQMYIIELPFYILGILFLFRKKVGYWWVVPLWALVGLIPASLARETPHALRTEAALPTFQILSAFGLTVFWQWVKERKKLLGISAKNILIILITGFFINILYFLHGYSVHYARETSKEWQYGYREAIEYVDSVDDNYDEIRSGRLMGRPYIYFLFYQKTDPKFFRETAEVERDIFGFVNIKRFGKYYFGEGEINEAPANGKVLVVETPERVPKANTEILKEVKYLDGEIAIVAYEFR
jgi:4-amino-4-deoxy-L-arabinose transferase-like glycosyltransferase